jgi:hypothetical protein
LTSVSVAFVTQKVSYRFSIDEYSDLLAR